ncbi:MAG: OmpA family protein [Flavobacteriaceae bacterium]|nr:OmpA family protein [Flavobacteriaceae bacterium]
MKQIVFLFLVVLFGFNQNTDAQILNKLAKKAEQKLNKEVDKVIDGDKKNTGDSEEGNNESSETTDANSKESGQKKASMETYSKFDFVPGEKVIFYDDFTEGNIGDFPIQWNTTGSGEVVTNNLFEGRWFNITNGRGATVLDQPITLPENYTIEFEVVPQKDQDDGDNVAWSFSVVSTSKPKDIDYGLARPGDAAIRFEFAYNTYYYTHYRDGSPELSGNTDKIKLLADKKYKISIWVQKERIRLYVDETKVFDLPKAMSKNYKYNMVRFDRGTTMFTNFRIATGLPDMRNKLMTEGKLVTYGIYFDVNKDIVKPESYGTLKEIAAILNEVPDVKVKIIGHTDADGADAANLDLSKRRAASVKAELAKSFGVNAERLETDGLGESKPVAPNDTPVNKALNRRVEFIKFVISCSMSNQAKKSFVLK